jgi:hypothetical protein
VLLPFDLPSDPQQPLPRLFVLADSISFFYGPYLEQMLAGRFTCDRKGTDLLNRSGWQPDLLARALSLDIESYDVNGGDSACVLEYLRQRPPACDLLLLNCGLHDLRVDPQTGAHQVEPGDYGRNLDEILALAAEIAPQAVWVRTTPVADARHNRLSTGFHRFNADVIAYNAIADQAVQTAGITSIDLYNFTLSLCNRLEDLDNLILDHVHFTEPVRRIQAAYIAGRLSTAGDADA